MRVAIKYCGSCNPRVDLPRIARRLHDAAHSLAIMLVPLDAKDVGLVVILNGCPIACADREDVRSMAGHSIVVAGETVNMMPVGQEALPYAVEGELRASLKEKTSSVIRLFEKT